ncbi:MAG: DUF1559 domain-containing protein, partial [Planctomycetes bacterium]|nr:DUF1559 domain-containing protein [Planctomycetota bacterium]
ELLNEPALQKILQGQEGELRRELWGVPLEQIEQALFAYSPGPAFDNLTRLVVRLRSPHRPEAIIALLKPERRTFAGGDYYTVPQPPHPFLRYFAAPDDRTLVFARDEAAIQHAVFVGPVNLEQLPWRRMFRIRGADVADAAFVAALPPSARRETPIAPSYGRGPSFRELVPLWRQFPYVVAAADIHNHLAVRLMARSDGADATDAARTAVTLSRNLAFRMAREEEGGGRRDPQAPVIEFLRLANRLLQSADIEAHGSLVEVELAAAIEDIPLASLLEGAELLSARNASAKKLKQLAIAMHNFHDTHRRFPAAVNIGPDGETRHSWRVALLPYLGEEARRIYDQYNQGEPWDSPQNQALIERMPDVFRHPLSPVDSTSSSYYVLTGPHTIFNGEGHRMAAIVDGTANTILIAEAQRNVPWTNPEDISVAPGTPLPELGGFTPAGYNVVAADGSAHFLPHTLDKTMLRRLIVRNDGMPINWSGGAR